MIYRAIQLIQIFLADERTNELTKVIQEVLADLKIREIVEHHIIKEIQKMLDNARNTLKFS